jgi:hypothetical protein
VRAIWAAIALTGCGFPAASVDPPSDGGDLPVVDGPPRMTTDAPPGTPDAPPPPPDAMPPPPPDAMPMATCPGYLPIVGGSPIGATYRGVSDRTPAVDAQDDCVEDGGNLVVVDNATEAAAVAGLVMDPGDPPGPSPYLWVGVFDPSGGGEGNWTTVLGQPATYLPWAAGQPNDPAANCVLLLDGSPYQFYDFDCTGNPVYVCECLP